MSNKKIIFSVILLCFLSFLYPAYKLNPDYRQINYKYINKTTRNEHIVTKRYEWTLNTGFLQYSSIIFIDKYGDAIFEGLTFLNYPKESDILSNKNINCLLLADNQLTASETFQIIKIPLMNKDGTNVALWKIKCKFKNLQFQESKVAIVDTNDFKGDQNDNIFKNLSTLIPKNNIKFQTTTIFNAKNKKYQSVANCVHLVRGLKSIKMKRLLNWLELQLMEKINIYMFFYVAQA